MNPTPEQVAQWAREAGLLVPLQISDFTGILHRLVTRAMAEQAEADAKTADGYVCAVGDEAYCIAAAIRANAPKVTT